MPPTAESGSASCRPAPSTGTSFARLLGSQLHAQSVAASGSGTEAKSDKSCTAPGRSDHYEREIQSSPRRQVMARAQGSSFLRFIRSALRAPAAGDRNDADLLHHFAAERDEAAFTAL